ncbi:hypothetical protein [Perlabentimonas gracilis]|uniref:hypothetical protein n=1 Tax=Perlabentimonas gracilis TaxID=2715279 RepID=UPI00140DCB52|nr:hypothetical protein [Perlabentimonas gracilis]NHB67312.1 hypothetical protein [Perlabentimonas gracilis]
MLIYATKVTVYLRYPSNAMPFRRSPKYRSITVTALALLAPMPIHFRGSAIIFCISGIYTKSLPLHHNQQILVDSKEMLHVKLEVFITEDFVMERISHGVRARVLEPQSQVNQIRSIHDEAVEGYG